MIISIAGCGWYGLQLAKSLIDMGIAVKGSSTTATKLPVLQNEGIKPYLLNLSESEKKYDPDFFACNILWICIPPKARSGNGESYLYSIDTIIALAKQYNIKQVVLISSTGVYADDNAEVDELNIPQPNTTSGNTMLTAEQLLKGEAAFTTTIIRFAGLIGPGRDPGRFFVGKKDIPNGNAPVNLIHLTDCIGISLAVIKQQAFGYTYNACSPDHPTKQAFYTKASTCAGLAVPEFIDEKKDWKIISSLYVNTILNYRYQINSLMNWLDTSVG
ncbi:MAG: NAD(P)H-binding protein [Mucilaginibacter sp.]